MKQTSNACIFYEDKLLLVKHVKKGLWMHVGGHVEPNELFLDAVKREIKEEVNLEVNILNPTIELNESNQQTPPFSVFCKINDKGEQYQCFDYIAVALDPENIKLQEEEVSEYVWVSKEELIGLDKDINSDFKEFLLKTFDLYMSLKNK